MKKKPTSIRLQIPEPCTQSFDKMHPLPGGHYCDKCEKTVVDFTDMSDGEMVRIFQKRQGRVCGVFRGDQLNRSMPLPMPYEKNRTWKAVAAFASALLFGNVAAGQTAEDFSKMTKEEVFMRGNEPIQQKTQTISGWVTNEEDVPLMYATVYLNGTNKGTETNEIGFFSIEVPSELMDQELTVSYMGYESQTLLWTKEEFENKPLYVFLKQGITLTEVVVTYERSLISGAMGGGMFFRQEFGKNEEELIEAAVENLSIKSIFPNPFISKINIEVLINKADAFLFHLYNEAGQLLFADTHELTTGTQTIRLNLNQRDLPEGLYFLRISDSIGEIRTKKLVKVNP